MAADITAGVQLMFDTRDAMQSAQNMESRFGSLEGMIKKVGAAAGVYLSFKAVKGAIGGVIASGAAAEVQLTKLETSVGNAAKAFDLYQQAVKVADVTPFETDEVVNSVVKLQAYSVNAFEEIGKTGVDNFTAIGNMAGSMGKSIDQATEAIADALTGEMERLKEFGVTVKMLPPEIQKLERGSREWQAAIMEHIATLPRFQGGMEKLAGTFTGLKSTIRGFFATFVRTMSGVGDTIGTGTTKIRTFFDDVKATLKGMVDWLKNNRETILNVARVIGQSLRVVWSIISGVLGIFRRLAEAGLKAFSSWFGSLGKGEDAIRLFATKIAFVRIYLELLFEDLTNFIVEHKNQFVSALVAITGVIAAKMIPSIISLSQAIMNRLVKTAFFAVIWAVTDLIMNWDTLSDKAKYLRGVIISFGTALLLISKWSAITSSVMLTKLLPSLLETGLNFIRTAALAAAHMVPALISLAKHAVITAGSFMLSLGQSLLKTGLNFVRTAALAATHMVAALISLAKHAVITAGSFMLSLGRSLLKTGLNFVRTAALAAAHMIPALIGLAKHAVIAAVSFVSSLIPSLVAGASAAWAFTVALLANPITWIVAGIAALAVGIVLLIKHWDDVKAAMSRVWEFIVGAFNKALNAMGESLAWIVDKARALKDALFGWIGGAVDKVKELAKAVSGSGLDAAFQRMNKSAEKSNSIIGKDLQNSLRRSGVEVKRLEKQVYGSGLGGAFAKMNEEVALSDEAFSKTLVDSLKDSERQVKRMEAIGYNLLSAFLKLDNAIKRFRISDVLDKINRLGTVSESLASLVGGQFATFFSNFVIQAVAFGPALMDLHKKFLKITNIIGNEFYVTVGLVATRIELLSTIIIEKFGGAIDYAQSRFDRLRTSLETGIYIPEVAAPGPGAAAIRERTPIPEGSRTTVITHTSSPTIHIHESANARQTAAYVVSLMDRRFAQGKS